MLEMKTGNSWGNYRKIMRRICVLVAEIYPVVAEIYPPVHLVVEIYPPVHQNLLNHLTMQIELIKVEPNAVRLLYQSKIQLLHWILLPSVGNLLLISN